MSSLFNSYGFLFAKAHQKIYDMLQPELSQIGISAKQLGLLFVIQDTPGITQKEAGTIQQIDRTSMTQSIDLLEELAFVQRIPKPNDRRCYGLYLTEKGESVTLDLWEKVYDAQQTLFLKLSLEDITNLKRILTIIAQG